jgi:hypothetical protein
MVRVRTYDLTHETKYPDTTLSIFEEIAYVSGANATCGGIWADTRHTQEDSHQRTVVSPYYAPRYQTPKWRLLSHLGT